MRTPASLRCDGVAAWAASGQGVATRAGQRGLDGAGAGRGPGTERKQAVPRWRPVTALGASSGIITTMARARGLDGVGAKEVATTTRAEGLADNDDNYGGGDDNYPRVVMAIEDEGREEELGWDRQK